MNEIGLKIGGHDGSALGRQNSVKFAQNYEKYFINQCDSDISKVRNINIIDFDYAESGSTDGLTPQYLKMHKNFSHIRLSTFRLQCLQIDSFKQFFNIFHCNLESLDIVFYGRRFNNVESMFFKPNSIIYNQMTKVEKSSHVFDGMAWLKNELTLELAFDHGQLQHGDSINETVDVNVESLLPRVDDLEITDEINQRDNGIVFAKFNQLLNSPKLLTLLNIHKSVTRLNFHLDGLTTFLEAKCECIVDTINHVVTKFEKLNTIEMQFNGYGEITNRRDLKQNARIMNTMWNKLDRFFEDGYFDKVLKILIEKSNIQHFKITWHTMQSFYNDWKLKNKKSIKINACKYSGSPASLYDTHKMNKKRNRFRKKCLDNDEKSWCWHTKVMLYNPSSV